jgi:aryl-alcohol dehydrogenase-like predicted oxidoreductase
MKKRMLGKRTGFEVTELGLGTWPLGGKDYDPMSESDAVSTVEAYIETGGNLIDTAPAYALSEAFIGKALAGKGIRDQLIVTTKTLQGDCIETIPEMRKDLEQSLKALQTDYIDVYFLHNPPDAPDAMNAALDELDIFKKEGKIRTIGASIKLAHITPATVALCRQYIDSDRLDVLEVAYSIMRQANAEQFAYARQKGVGVIARSVLESGFLTGKYKPGHAFSRGHRSRWETDTLKTILDRVEGLEKTAVPSGYENLTQAAVQFVLASPEVSCVIIGAETPDEVRANAKIAGLPPLDPALVEDLRKQFAGLTESFNPGRQKID